MLTQEECTATIACGHSGYSSAGKVWGKEGGHNTGIQLQLLTLAVTLNFPQL
jgi:hypothetical protein